MSAHRLSLRAGEFLIRCACWRLPGEVRDERYREWAAELPVILDDGEVRFMAMRVLRMLAYAADQSRGSRRIGKLAVRRQKAAADRAAAYGFLQLIAWELLLKVLGPIQDQRRGAGR